LQLQPVNCTRAYSIKTVKIVRCRNRYTTKPQGGKDWEEKGMRREGRREEDRG